MKPTQKIYTVENLDCPNCAAKIEAAIAKLDGIEAASLSYTAMQLRVTASDTEDLLSRIQQASDSVEDGVIFTEKAAGRQKRRVYTFENIDCPNCAAKIEAAIAKIDGVESASLSYTTGLLHVTADDYDGLLEKIQAASDSVEEGAIFREKSHGTHHHTHHEHEHEHHHDHDHCDCGHEHEHEHEHHHDHEHEHHHEHRHDHAQEHHHEHEHAHHADTERITLIVGAVLFVIGLVLHIGFPALGIASKVILLAAYLVLGAQVLLASVKSIGKGQIFDENFLMAVATIGALCIGSWEEAAGVMLFYRIGELFEHLAVQRSRKSVMDAIDMRPETVLRLEGGETIVTPAEEIEPGERILVRAGDRIPIDSIVVKGESSVDTAAITGEPVPVDVRPGDEVLSGCINLSGVLELETTAALEDSLVQRILESVENAAAGKPELDRFITRFARVYTPVVVAIAVLTAIVPSLITGNWSHWIYTALNFLMISCPCALVLSVPLAFFSGIGAGSVKGILFKDGMALENLARIDTVVMDKTGTLTQGRFSVTASETAGDPADLIRYAAACEHYSTHPVAKCILDYAQTQGIAIEPAKDVQEHSGKGLTGIVDGHAIACGNDKLMAEAGIPIPAVDTPGTIVYVACDGAYFGYLLLSDTPKAGAKETVQSLHGMGLHTVMLTGDTAAHTEETAKALGIDEVHAQLLPTDKLTRLKEIMQQRGSVYFIGDGINDTLVLSQANVSAAMGTGADAAMEVADVVLMRSDPQSILQSIAISRRVNKTAIACVVFALAVKAAIMLLGFCGFANMWLSVFADTGVTILCILFVLARIHWHYRKQG